ncbi:LysM peptidoglycan-binding domain-containing protein [Candidatus Comchoanobacter bicostacola]|uniref:LysM peptidoglycan-binding domain-containing protein n=1 Tax=Candidatus Comchoanobacter bicostacola TaxID=2919598 RepID=A0ABY5DKI4_9GAMM|nr:LysM peptidoglycan-binding domain-containing protein [Candidatus Comchoanobacter bicostacola]UTC24325.1 LysM peptidoglycan-binding domain-containing protein [Candidatus Comchoanobacter bicostacola]
MSKLSRLVTLTALTSLLAGCQKHEPQDIDTEMHTEPTPSQSESSAWQKLKSRMGLSQTNSHLSEEALEQLSLHLANNKSQFAYVAHQCELQGLPIEVAFIPLMISNYDPSYQNNGQHGLWGLTDAQAAQFGLPNDYWVSGKNDPVLATEAALSYIKFLYSTFNQDWELAVAAFTNGINPVMRAVHHNQAQGLDISLSSLPLETSAKSFVETLRTTAHNTLEYSDTHSLNISEHDQFRIINMPSQFDIKQASSALKIDEDALKKLNAGFKRPMTHPKGLYRLLVPASYYDKAKRISMDPSIVSFIAKESWINHRVQPGDSLSVIAQRNNTTLHEIKKINQLTSDQIYVNQLILIPPIARPDLYTESDQSNLQRVIHNVSDNETLYSIARNYNHKVSDVMYWNQLDSKFLTPGQQLVIWKAPKIESPYLYKVKADDSLSKIARKHHTTVSAIQKANNITSSIIHPNDSLIIPQRTNAEAQDSNAEEEINPV